MTTSISSAAGAPGRARGRPRVALVLGSGGLKCAAAIGLWRVLEREGIPIDTLVGCSGGAIYASVIALGLDPDWCEQNSRTMWRDLFKRVRYRAVARSLLPHLFGLDERVGLIDDRRVGRVMELLYGDATFADARIPLHVAATDLRTGERVTLHEGRLADAVRASISIPLLLPPWTVDGRLLVDGGASNPLPIDVAIRERCDVIIAMGFEYEYGASVASLLGAARQTTYIVMNQLLRATFAFHSAVHHAELIPIMPEFGGNVGLGDTHLIGHIVEEGARAAEEQVPYLRRLLADAAR